MSSENGTKAGNHAKSHILQDQERVRGNLIVLDVGAIRLVRTAFQLYFNTWDSVQILRTEYANNPILDSAKTQPGASGSIISPLIHLANMNFLSNGLLNESGYRPDLL